MITRYTADSRDDNLGDGEFEKTNLQEIHRTIKEKNPATVSRVYNAYKVNVKRGGGTTNRQRGRGHTIPFFLPREAIRNT